MPFVIQGTRILATSVEVPEVSSFPWPHIRTLGTQVTDATGTTTTTAMDTATPTARQAGGPPGRKSVRAIAAAWGGRWP